MNETAARLLVAFVEEDPSKRYDVVWLGEQGPDGAKTRVLRVAPLSVGGLLRERLFGQHTVVLTSATLTLGGSFDALARQWGLPPTSSAAQSSPAQSSPAQSSPAQSSTKPEPERAAPAEPPTTDPVPDPQVPRWTGLDVGSPFQHERAGILYVAKRLPTPGRDGLAQAYLDEIAELITAAGGGTLGLFSSMRAAKQATEALRPRLAQPILCQGDDSTSLLVRKFAEDDATCLFGTLSLWQGVDVPGRSLRLVLIDRIPFPRPDDPLVSARQRAVDARGGNGFLTVSATHAALLLAQGAGRLLRGMDDISRRGRLSWTPGLATARYGGFLRGLAAAVLADHRPRGGPRRAAQTGHEDLAQLGQRAV